MKFYKQLVAAALMLSGCAQQPTISTPVIAKVEPRSTAAQQRLAASFDSTPCAALGEIPSDKRISDTAISLAGQMRELSRVNPEDIPDYSSHAFNRYLNELDSKHLYFLQSDINDFKQYQEMLWAALEQGNVKPGFCIYDRYKQRLKENLQSAADYLENKITEQDLHSSEQFSLRDQNSAYFKSDAEKSGYWRKKAIYDVLMKMTSDSSFSEAKQNVLKRYKGQLSHLDKTTPDDIFAVYANSFLWALDAHSQYFAPKVREGFTPEQSLRLEGIGIVLQQDDEGAVVVSAVAGGPADGKLNPGDIVISVAKNGTDFQPIAGWRLDDIVNDMRGPKGSFVGLEIKPAQQNTNIVRMSIMRDTVKLKDREVESETLTINRAGKTYIIGIAHVPTFYADFRAAQAGDPNAKSVTVDLARHVLTFKRQGIDGLVIDLVNNGGGSLSEANGIASLFITNRPTFLVNAKSQSESMISHNNSRIFDGPVVVLVNDRSAGASEIVAAALQDYGAGLVVGQRTYGMGSVASMRPLAPNSAAMLKISMAEFVRATGEPFLGKGVTPDIVLPSATPPIREANSANPREGTYATKSISTMSDLSGVRGQLKSLSVKRQSNDPAFEYIRDTHKSTSDLLAESTFELNLASATQRKQNAQKASQQRFESYKKAGSIPDNITYQDSDKVQKQAWQRESGELIVDWLEMDK